MFAQHFSRRVVDQFDGAWMTSDGGGLLLRQTDRKIPLLERVVAGFTDGRDPQRVEHPLAAMLAQRIYGLALGYEDLNDHEELRRDPLLALLAGKRERTSRAGAKSEHQHTGQAARSYSEFPYQTRHSWSRSRRVVAKAECLDKGENPRFVVTSLTARAWPAPELCEQLYCARGDMENRIKEQLSLFADRMSTETLRANQRTLSRSKNFPRFSCS